MTCDLPHPMPHHADLRCERPADHDAGEPQLWHRARVADGEIRWLEWTTPADAAAQRRFYDLANRRRNLEA